MLSAIGMSFVLSNYSQVAQGARSSRCRRSSPAAIHYSNETVFAVRLSNVQIVVVVTTIVLLAIFTWLVAADPARPRHARLRAGSDHAALLGVDVDRTISMTFVIGAALAASPA